MGLISDTVTIKTETLDTITAANLVPGAYVSVTDPAGGNMNGNVFQISNIRTEIVPATIDENITYTQNVIWTDSIASTVSSRSTIELTSGLTTDINTGLGVKATGVDPKLVQVKSVEFNKGRAIVAQVNGCLLYTSDAADE